MNEPGDLPLTHTSTPDGRPPCSIISIIPMSSCRGRAEAFARSLSSKLRTLGSQTNEEGGNAEDEPIINGTNTNTWVTAHESEQTVTDLQPLRHESDSFFDFDCESPGSPVDECEYLRLIETASNTPHNSTAESGYACASAASSHSSTDGPYFDAAATASAPDQLVVVTTQQPQRIKLLASELNEYVNALKLNGSHEHLTNGELEEVEEEEATSREAPKKPQSPSISSESTEKPELTLLQPARTTVIVTEAVEDEASLQAQILSELQQQSDKFKSQGNGHCNSEILDESEAPEAPAEHSEGSSNGQLLTEDLELAIPEILREPEEILTITRTETEDTPDAGVDEVDKTGLDCNSHKLSVDVEIAQQEQIKTELAAEAETEAEDVTPAESVEAEAEIQKTSHSHGIDTTDDEDDCRPQRVRRCSSLKTGKTPPGTPGRKKIVRFADVLGLDLADVKTFLDEIPTIPKSAFEDLEILEAEPPLQLGPKSDKLLMPLFQQPGGLPTFLDAVREKQVSLENAAVTDNINQTISGSVRVRNLDFHKSVHIRYSLDGWRSYADLQANYVENSCDGFSDKFTFVLFGNSLHVGQRLEFAVRFQCKGQQFWDNNYGANYCFQCLPSSNHAASSGSVVSGSVPTHHASSLVGLLSPAAGDAWCSSFY